MINLLKNAAESGSPPDEITASVRAQAEGFIVEAHGGRLSLANRPGGGAVVTVWLP